MNPNQRQHQHRQQRQSPPGSRFDSASPQRQQRQQRRNQTNDTHRNHRGTAAPAEQGESSWWGPLEGVWNSFMMEPVETEQQRRQRIQREKLKKRKARMEQQRLEHHRQLQMKTQYDDRQHMDGILREEVHHHELMIPQDDGTNVPVAPPYRPQPRQQRPQQQRPPVVYEKDGFVMEQQGAKSKHRNLSPLRSRTPPTGPNRSPLRQQQHSPVPPPPPDSPIPPPPPPPPEKPFSDGSGGIWAFFFGTEKRRLNFWTVLSILMLGPPIFLGGFYAGHGLESNPRIFVAPHDGSSSDGPGNGGPGSDQFRPTLPPYVYETNIFMIQDEVLKQDERLFLTSTNQGVHLKQESNGNLVLYDRDKTVMWHSGLIRATLKSQTYSTTLQGDGNLVTHSTTYDKAQRMWSTQVEWSSASESLHHGEYTLLLTPNADGLMIIRRVDSEIIWSTVPVELEASPTAYPTNQPFQTVRPTRPPVDYPTPNPTMYPTRTPTLTPTDYPTMAPSPRPTMFPWPDTVPQSQVYSLESGPLVGHTTHDSCKFWVFLGRPVPMQLVYWPHDDSGSGTDYLASSQTVFLYPDAESNGAAIETILGLQPDTLYLYEVRVSNEWLSQGHFKTAPAPKQATSFKYLLASCMNVKSNDGGYRNQPVWNEALDKDIDFAMLPGDTVYLNNNDWTPEGEMIYDRIWYRNMQQRAEVHFARLIKTVPTYGSWDDHDYGKNNAEHRQKGKKNSLEAWAHLWPNPYQGSPKGTGNYYSYSWGDVDFFVLDCRWYRNSYNGTLFGDPQLEWLEEELIASTATFKIIVSASDVMEKSMTRDVKDIGKIVSRNSISGVLFNSGDIHRNEYKVQDLENWPYRVHQLTSSGIARVWRRNFAIINVNTGLNDPEVKAEFYAADSRERLTTWSNDPNLECGSSPENENRQSKCTQRIRLSELTP